MATQPRSLSWFAAVALVATFAAACSDSTGPGNLSDPAALSAELDAVDDAFETPVFESFDRLGDHIQTAASVSLGQVFLVTQPTLPEGDTQPSVENARAARELQLLASRFENLAPQDSFLPDAVLGTYEWDTSTDQYVKTARLGAPANTVRFILYAIDPLTHLPVEPLDEVGYVDLTDNQPATSATYSLGVVVRDSAGTTTYLDYDITVQASPSSFTASAAGQLTNALTGPAGRTLTFSVQFAATGSETSGSVSVDAMFTLSPGGISAELHDDATISGNSITFTRDFRFHRPGEVIRVQGTVTIAETSPGVFIITIDVTVHVNGRLYATAEGNSGSGFTVTGPGGRELTPEERAVLEQLLDAPNEIFDVSEDLFEPAENITP